MEKEKKKPGRPKKDRHVNRKLVGLDGDLHAALTALAERNSRPLTWELRRIAIEALTREGLWPLAPGA